MPPFLFELATIAVTALDCHHNALHITANCATPIRPGNFRLYLATNRKNDVSKNSELP
jgi:hypothetical protein